jgi:DNA processing protein
LGCDTAGHKGALIVNGITTDVLAHGLDKVIQNKIKPLQITLLKKGVLLSEYFVNQGPLANYFVERDRYKPD